jgi:hypothetical protein
MFFVMFGRKNKGSRIVIGAVAVLAVGYYVFGVLQQSCIVCKAF